MRMKKIKFLLLTLVALVGGLTASATKTVYVDPVGNGTWMADNPAISLYVFGDGDGWATSETLSDGVIKFTFDDKYTSMIIVRSDIADSWSGSYKNQTADITSIEVGKLYKANGYNVDQLIFTVEDYTEPAPAPGYTVDFNTAIAVPSNNHSDPMFKVSTGWTRIADRKDGDGYYGTAGYYMRYTYSSTAGVSGTGTLLANAQQAPQSTYDGSIETVYDYIVTPKVSGTVTLQVKGSTSASSSLPSFISFYAVDDNATTIGSELVATYSAELNTSDFVTATLTLSEPTRIAIRGQWVYIDNFTATSAEIPEVKALTVTSVMNSNGQSGFTGTNPSFEQQSDGKLLVKLKVAIQNTGNVNLVAGSTENYTLTLASASSESATKTYYEDAAITLTEDLAVGASTTIDVEVAVNYTDTYGSYRYWFVRENVSGTTSSSYRYATSVAYEPKFIFREAGSTSSSSINTAEAWGTITSSTTKSFEIANTGTAPLTIKSVTLPDGFTSDNAPTGAEVILAKGETLSLNITNDASTQGTFTGDLKIVYLDKDNAEQTYTLAFAATVIGANTWVAEFDVASSSETNYPTGSVAESGIRFGTSYIASDNYNGYLYSYTSTSYANENNKFITPKLHANAGDVLSFDVRRDDSSSATYKLKVYVSTDRKTWGEPVFTVSASDLTSSFQTKEISFADAGDYYVAFAIYGVRVDNIIGLQKVDVAHDLYIKEVTWPDATVNSGASISSKPKVVIIPLTDEAASNYTVKYMYGETVLAEATPVALTASANSSKDFSFTWTPTVANTTTYNGTKVVFDFGGGVTFETEPFDLTVVNEPKFHFVKTLPSSKWNEPSDYTTPITFGKTNTADVQTFYINNWGSAPLQVKSIVMPTGFTTSVSAPLTVAAFNGETDGIAAASQALDITFSATEAGLYSGDMVITYVDGTGADATFTLAVSGTKLDPNAWYANFDNASTNDCNWPAGSVYQSGVSGSTGSYSAPYNYYISSTSTTNNLFITPKLSAVAGDKLLFDAKLYNSSSSWSDGKVVVYAAATRDELINFDPAADTRNVVFTASGTDATNTITTDYKTFEIPAVAGNNYYAFEISNRPYVDELYGLKLAEVAHDLQIASSNIPTEGMQNYASTATVNVLNFGLANDKVSVTAYVNGVAVATSAETEVAMNHKLTDAGTQVSVSYMSNVKGTFPVYLEVKAGDVTVATDPVDVTFVQEVAVSDAIEVGARSSADRYHGPVDWYNTDGSSTRWTDIVYTAAELKAFGISAGSKITSIAFKGAGTSKSMKAKVTSWVGTKTGDITPGNVDKSAMTEVSIYNQTDAAAMIDFSNMVIDLSANPITFDGTSDIRIYTEAVGQGSSNWQTVTYAYDDNYKNSYFNSSSAVATPLGYFTLATSSATLAGTVKTSAGAGIEGATITLKADNGVQYSGTTDATGAYSINVIQAGLDFTATVKATGYLKKQFAMNMNGASATKDVQLFQKIAIVGNFPGFNDFGTDYKMTQDAENPNKFTVTIPNIAVDATTYRYKLRADNKWADADGGFEFPSSGDNNWDFNGWYTAGTYNLTFTAVIGETQAESSLTLEPVLQLTLNNSETTANTYNAKADVTIGRTLKTGWNAIVLPFAIDADEITAAFGTEAEVAKFYGDVVNGENVSITFTKSDVIEANVPYLLHLDAVPAAANLKFKGKAVTFAEAKVEGNAFDFVGIYADGTAAEGDFIMAGGKFKQAAGGNVINAYRSYLQKKTSSPVRGISFYIDDELIDEFSDTTTGINGVNAGENAEGVYNLSGQKVNNTSKKGVYIMNGKKVVVTNRR